MAALQYVDVPGYAALLLRRRYSDLTLPEALMARAEMWLRGQGPGWDEQEKTWRFPSGATLTFGYLETENDKFRYQGSAFQFVGFDELTQFMQSQYRYLFSRLRRLKGHKVPIRMRAATNPGGVGHEWVNQRFLVEGRSKGRVFVPARLADNPYLDREEYLQTLAELDPVTQAQLANGDWNARAPGGYFDRTRIQVLDAIPEGRWRWHRHWDLASTEPNPENPDPDWTVGFKMGELNGYFLIADVIRKRLNPGDTETLVRHTAEADGPECTISMEQEPGSAGKIVIARYVDVLKGYAFRGIPSSKDKVTRAKPFSAAAHNRKVNALRATWNSALFDELEAFPAAGHDDQVDGGSGAHGALTRGGKVRVAKSEKQHETLRDKQL